VAEEEHIARLNERRAVLAQNLATAERITARLDNLHRQVQGFHQETEQDALSLDLTTQQLLQVTVDKTVTAVNTALWTSLVFAVLLNSAGMPRDTGSSRKRRILKDLSSLKLGLFRVVPPEPSG
jgi:hypothetical protein